MAKTAHQLNYPAPRRSVVTEEKPELRVSINVKKRKRKERIKVFGIVITVAVMLFLICGMLYTQSTIAELQTNLNLQTKELAEVNTENRNLTSQLDSKVNLKTIEQQAADLGLVKMENGQKIYIRSQAGNQIIIQQNGLSKILSSAQDEISNVVEN